MKPLLYLILGVFFLYCSSVAALYLAQEKLIFVGTKLPSDFRFKPLPGVSEKYIEVDGATLSALHYQNEAPRGLIFFLHGNAGNLDSWLPDIDFYQQQNYDLFMLDYRGYGKSTGTISSQHQLEQDVLKAWQSVVPGYQARQLPIVIYGRSLGTYLATQLSTQLAIKEQTDLLVLVSPYTSMLTMANILYPWVPNRILRYPLATDAIIDQVETPTLILHGDQDNFIPLSQAQKLEEIVLQKGRLDPAQIKLVIVKGASHNDIHDFDQYNEALAEALPN